MSQHTRAQLTLVMRQGPQPSRVFTLHKDSLSLGRALDNDIVIEDNEVSRHHARLARHGDVWILEDLNSRNGTTFNGQRITGPVVLTPGSQVGLGPDVFLGAQEAIPAADETLFSQPSPAGETLPPTPVPQVVSPTAPTTPFQVAPPQRNSGRWYVLVGAVVAVLLLLARAAAAAYLYLKPTITGPSAVAGLPGEEGPFVAFQDPAPGTHVDEGDSVLVFATARDEDKVTRLDLWLDDKLMAQQTSPDPDGVSPLSLIHSLVADEPGTHALTVRAYNALGQMGESPPINLTVLEADEEETEEPEPSLYVVQQGDTLESIAKKLGSTVAAIKGTNPGLGDTVNTGQIIAVPLQQGIVSPPQAPDSDEKTPQAQAWAGKQGQQTPPAKDGQKAPIKPPQQPTPKTPPRVNKGPAPIWDPSKQKQGANPNAPLPSDPPKNKKDSKTPVLPPVLEKPAVGDCRVTLKWQDRSGASRFFIKRWSGSPPKVSAPMASKAKDTFEDKVPGPGTYWYAVVAEKGSGKDKVTKESNRVRADVAKSAACVGEPTYKQIYFQPLSLEFKDGSYKRAALFVDVGGVAGRRIPDKGGQYLERGEWKRQGKEVYPAPSSLYVDPEQEMLLWMCADACPSKTPPDPVPKVSKANCDDLPPVEERYTARELAGAASQARTAQGQDFTASYRLWLEDVQWTGKGTTKDIPAPKLALAKSESDIKNKTVGWLPGQPDPARDRILVWEMPKGTKDKIDGYILYRKYACPGKDPATVPELIPDDLDGIGIDPISEPVACEAEYRVSAYGRAGESAPSNPVSAKTTSAVAVVTVSFDELKTDKEHSSSLTLSANEYHRVSSQMYMTPTFQLNLLPFDGMTGNNVIPVHLKGKDSLTLMVALTQWDFSVNPPEPKLTCDVEKTISPPKDGWESLKPKEVTLDSGSKPDCTVKVSLNGRGLVDAGKEIRPEADVVVAKLLLIGRDIYVLLFNGGPDRLPSNQIKLQLKWGDEKGKTDVIRSPITRWWPPDQPEPMVKLYTIPASEDLEAMMKETFFTVEVTPVDFTDPDSSNNAKIDEKLKPGGGNR